MLIRLNGYPCKGDKRGYNRLWEYVNIVQSKYNDNILVYWYYISNKYNKCKAIC